MAGLGRLKGEEEEFKGTKRDRLIIKFTHWINRKFFYSYNRIYQNINSQLLDHWCSIGVNYIFDKNDILPLVVADNSFLVSGGRGKLLSNAYVSSSKSNNLNLQCLL